MGIVDRTYFALKCDTCGATETAPAVEQGSDWSFSWNLPDFKSFAAQWVQVSKGEPTFQAATCNQCDGTASVQ